MKNEFSSFILSPLKTGIYDTFLNLWLLLIFFISGNRLYYCLKALRLRNNKQATQEIIKAIPK